MHFISAHSVFLLISCCWPIFALAANNRTIHVEWQYPAFEPKAVGFILYQQGHPTCQVADGNTRAFDCTVYLPDFETTYFTMTALLDDGTESPQSPPFFMAAIQGFDRAYYLSQKLNALQSDPETAADWAGQDTDELLQVLAEYGFTPETHYLQYGNIEGLAPNKYFNATEYTLAKAKALLRAGTYSSLQNAIAAFQNAWSNDPYLHYLTYGDEEGINPSNSFDVSAYLEEKLAALQVNPATAAQYHSISDVRSAIRSAGLTTLGHFLQYGIQEGLVAPAVPAPERVSPE